MSAYEIKGLGRRGLTDKVYMPLPYGGPSLLLASLLVCRRNLPTPAPCIVRSDGQGSGRISTAQPWINLLECGCLRGDDITHHLPSSEKEILVGPRMRRQDIVCSPACQTSTLWTWGVVVTNGSRHTGEKATKERAVRIGWPPQLSDGGGTGIRLGP